MPLAPSLLSIRPQRAMGEFGAVSVISGNIIGQTQTLTLYVESAYKVGGWHGWRPYCTCWIRSVLPAGAVSLVPADVLHMWRDSFIGFRGKLILAC